MHLYTYILCFRVRCICGCVTFLKSRMSYEKLHDCEGTFNTRCEGAKAQASNRSSIPLGSSASAKSNPRPTTLLSTQQQFKTTREHRGKHGVGFCSHVQGPSVGRLECRQDMHRASLLRRTVLRHLHLDNR